MHKDHQTYPYLDLATPVRSKIPLQYKEDQGSELLNLAISLTIGLDNEENVDMMRNGQVLHRQNGKNAGRLQHECICMLFLYKKH